VTTGPGSVVLVAELYPETLLPGGPAADAERACSGVATVTIDPTPHGTFNTAVARFEISLVGCPPGIVLTNVFLSRTDAGENEHFDDMWIGSDLGETLVASGGGVFRSINAGVPQSRAEAVIAKPTDFGVRAMSTNNPFGFLKGQLRLR